MDLPTVKHLEELRTALVLAVETSIPPAVIIDSCSGTTNVEVILLLLNDICSFFITDYLFFSSCNTIIIKLELVKCQIN
jgi:hypothetical protein